jgi:hypothetical protein
MWLMAPDERPSATFKEAMVAVLDCLWELAHSDPADLFTRLLPPAAPGSDGLGATSSHGSLDRERANSPPLSVSLPAHPPVHG